MLTQVWSHFDGQTKDIFGPKEFFCSPFVVRGLLPEQEPYMEMRLYANSKKMETYKIPWHRSFALYAKSKSFSLPETYISEIRISPLVTDRISQLTSFIVPIALPSQVGHNLMSVYEKGKPHATGHVVKRLGDVAQENKFIHFDTAALDGYLRMTDRSGKEETMIPIGDEEASAWPGIIRVMDAFENLIAMRNYEEDIYISWTCNPTYIELTFHEPDVPQLEMKTFEEQLCKMLRHFGTLYMKQFVNQIESAK